MAARRWMATAALALAAVSAKAPAARAQDAALAAAPDTTAATATMAPATPELVDRIMVVVDEEAILQSDLEREIALYHLEARNMGAPDDKDETTVRAEVLDRLIESKLIIAAARREEIEIGEESVEREVQANIDQLVRYYGSQARLEAELADNAMTLDDYRRRSASQLRDQHYMRAVVNRFIRPGIEVREEEVEAYYAAHRDEVPAAPDTLALSDILIAVQPSPEVQRDLQAKLGAVMQELGRGDAFGAVADRHTAGPGAGAGGRIGLVRPGELFSRALEDAVFSLQEGETSQPVVTERGLHVVHVDKVGEEGREISQIFFPIEVTEDDVARSRAEAEAAHARLAAGEPFAKVAAEVSVDPGSAPRGGELGTFVLDELSPTIREHLAEAAAGAITPPFLTPAGFYIFLVRERTAGASAGFEELRDQVRQAVESQKLQEALAVYVEGLRARFAVDRKD